jgi:hypothetical protein
MEMPSVCQACFRWLLIDDLFEGTPGSLRSEVG